MWWGLRCLLKVPKLKDLYQNPMLDNDFGDLTNDRKVLANCWVNSHYEIHCPAKIATMKDTAIECNAILQKRHINRLITIF